MQDDQNNDEDEESDSYGDETDDENPFDAALLTKEMVKAQKFTLRNLTKFLNIAIKGLKQIEGSDDLIMAIGNTGCGKSTLITSLIYGPEALEEKMIEIPIQVVQSDGTFKEKINQFLYFILCLFLFIGENLILLFYHFLFFIFLILNLFHQLSYLCFLLSILIFLIFQRSLALQ